MSSLGFNNNSMKLIHFSNASFKISTKKPYSQIRAIQELQQPYSPISLTSDLSFMAKPTPHPLQTPKKNTHHQRLLTEEQKVVQKIVKTKMQSGGQERRRSLTVPQKGFIVTRSKLSDSESLELKLNKPTDRYFHRLDNVRIAKNILFVRPSEQVARNSLFCFFRRQSQYKQNIRKMAVKWKKPRRNQKEWVS